MLRTRLAALFLILPQLACQSTSDVKPLADQPDGPFVVLLGTAQDGGLPQMGCQADLCREAREDEQRRRLVTSLLIVDPRTGNRWLIDATPDIREQVELANRWAPQPEASGRPPLFEGVFLSHAHFGHYTGLAYFGREVYGSDRMQVWASDRMRSYLSSNGPWDLLVEAGHIELQQLAPGEPLPLGENLTLEAFTVPHRGEYTDTFGFVVRGPERALIYIPDIDKWSVFETNIEDLIAACDFALLDGSFFADGEIPGRAMSEIPHPFIEESLTRFSALDAIQRAKVHFTHLNHTNPASDPGSAAAEKVRVAGMNIAREGQVLEL